MRLDELRRELVCIATEAETAAELIGAIEELAQAYRQGAVHAACPPPAEQPRRAEVSESALADRMPAA